MVTSSPSPDMEALKTRLKSTWESGDYGVFAEYLEPGALEFFDRLNIPSGTNPPPPIFPSPLLWGKEDKLRERFGSGVRDLRITRQMYPFRYPFAPADVVDFFIKYYGPTLKAAASLDEAGKTALRNDLIELWSRNNRASDGSTDLLSEYVEVVGTRV